MCNTPAQTFIKTREGRGHHKTCNSSKTLKAKPTAVTKIRVDKLPQDLYRKRKRNLVNDGFKRGKPLDNQFGTIRINMHM